MDGLWKYLESLKKKERQDRRQMSLIQFFSLTSLILSSGSCSPVILHFPIITVSSLYCKHLLTDHFISPEMTRVMIILFVAYLLIFIMIISFAQNGPGYNEFLLNEWTSTYKELPAFSRCLILVRRGVLHQGYHMPSNKEGLNK